MYLCIEILLSIIVVHASQITWFYFLFGLDISFTYKAYSVLFKPVSHDGEDEQGEVNIYHDIY